MFNLNFSASIHNSQLFRACLYYTWKNTCRTFLICHKYKHTFKLPPLISCIPPGTSSVRHRLHLSLCFGSVFFLLFIYKENKRTFFKCLHTWLTIPFWFFTFVLSDTVSLLLKSPISTGVVLGKWSRSHFPVLNFLIKSYTDTNTSACNPTVQCRY